MNVHFITCTVTSLHKLALFLIVSVTALWIDVSRTCLLLYFKTINDYPPEYLRELFRLRDNTKNLRGVNKLQVPKTNRAGERERERGRERQIQVRICYDR